MSETRSPVCGENSASRNSFSIVKESLVSSLWDLREGETKMVLIDIGGRERDTKDSKSLEEKLRAGRVCEVRVLLLESLKESEGEVEK